MRHVLSVLLVLIMALPAVQAQSPSVEGVHLQWRADHDQYGVIFQSDLPLQDFDLAYTVEGQEEAASVATNYPGYGRSSVYGFRFPPNATGYRIEDRSFEVRAPPPGPHDATRVAFLADVGMTADTRAVLDAVRAADVDAILLGGDLSYADGDVEAWDEWFRFMEPYVSDVPVTAARGNHEARCIGRAGVNLIPDCRTDEQMFLDRFDQPLEELYHATEWGPLRIIVVDTEAYFHREDPLLTTSNVHPDVQLAFVADALRAPPGVWTLVIMHRPLYSSNGAHGSELLVRQHMEPALVEGGADLVLAGHDHAYERTWPVAYGEPVVRSGDTFVADVPVYVMSGGGGQSLYRSWQPEPVWSAAREAAFHFTLIEADADTLTVTAVAATGDVLDRFTLTRSPEEAEAGVFTPLASWLAVAALAGTAVLRRRARS